jgi:uncharacterized protein DUF1573/flagellar associated PapD-like protein
MLRNMCWSVLVVLALAPAASAKDWAVKMFATTSHDFGHVARGAKSEFAFEIQNSYEEEVHIADVRTSCGCISPTITKPTLKTWEKGSIIASFNTAAFLGQRTATLTVVIDKPFYAEVPLTITGYIHGDVDFQPGSVAFGDVDQGAVAEKELAVTYYGRGAWQITDVRSVNEHLEVELSEPRKLANGVTYKMKVRLKGSAPAGQLTDHLSLVTSDPRMPSVAVEVEGRVVPPLAVSPASLFLGVLKPGQVVTKQLVVTGKQPFKVTSVKSASAAFAFKPTDVAKKVHLIPVTYTAGQTPGEIEETIEIDTDLASGGHASCPARGTIQAAASTASAPEAGRF